MLKKLMKYEFRATGRTFLPMYGLLLIFAVLNRWFLDINKNYMNTATTVISIISMVVYIGLLVGVSVLTLVVIIRRFYNNLLTDEGYLMFTLPVSSSQNLNSKLITSVIWSVLSAVASYFSIYIMTLNLPEFSIKIPYKNIIQWLKMTLGVSSSADAWSILILGILVVILGVCVTVLLIYASIAVGHLSGDHKKLTAVGAFIGFGIIEQVVMSIGIISGNGIYQNLGNDFAGTRTGIVSLQCGMLGVLAFELVFSIAYYITINQILKKKLNLE